METEPIPPRRSDRLIEHHDQQEAEHLYKENVAILELTLQREASEMREAENHSAA